MSNSGLKPVKALHRINGSRGSNSGRRAGDVFVPADKAEDENLRRLEAVRDLTEAELALFEKTQPQPAASTDKGSDEQKPQSGGRGRGRQSQQQQQPASGEQQQASGDNAGADEQQQQQGGDGEAQASGGTENLIG